MENGNAPSIIFKNISLSLGGEELFKNLSLTIEGGECTCILGPSGCGKSTLLRLVSGAPSLVYQGEVNICSQGVEADKKTAWMSQDDLLLPWFSLLDNILLGAKLRNQVSPAIREKAYELIAAAGLSGYEKTLPSALSGGMRQRGALLRTLMEDRSVLLMDEPFSALDALTRMKLQNLSAELTRGATVVLVTHDPMEALRMGNTIIVLSGKPARVQCRVSLSGAPPREADDPEVQKHFSVLLNELLNEPLQ